MTKDVGLYDIKYLFPEYGKYKNQDLQLRTIHYAHVKEYAKAMYCLLKYNNGLQTFSGTKDSGG
jgi:hypothetical protein